METAAAPRVLRETDVIAGLLAGDEKLYERVVREHGPRLLAVCRRFLRNEEDARDAVQEAFVSAMRGLPGFERGCRLATWLHRIAVNCCLMTLRTRRRHPEHPIDDLLPEFRADGHHKHPSPPWKGVDALYEQAEARRMVREAIDALPESYRTVLLLREIEGFTTAEAARDLDITENAVKLRLHRARQALRELLDRKLRGGRR
ncbi:MAG TPA: sigma-70 family RNA polymerase sigma factor [Thermoanaerobaculia bacterium]|nr:sigma-70 family RNA polymerase sigma factor [Thermoanaerobaculia bacterium]